MANVEVSLGDIFAHEADAILSPANSFGHMDGGIDLLYSRYFGWDLQTNLQAALAEQHYGELPVGQAIVLATGHARFPFLVSAPTMRVPARIDQTVNVYLAFRAALIAVLTHNAGAGEAIGSLLVPGLGTGVGSMPPARAARQMRLAYDSIFAPAADRRSARAILREHHELLS
ncbi:MULTISPECIES: macro domain-containing protein [unclassified Bradyrhizobium]|uniref:macro domain-containing protein n=1 Tax=unclassified Bradyrhizobium TaxID=2631580 RepID=UPI00211E5769|nr:MULTISPECIES: macro domain-containing protein [unclassified Bradyrhizobium]MDD1536413.1 Appr-1-p processing protein [Bradyrhizobium sp. WBOS8]MDD1586180.1 Appr-1-p processing protein [Bradyrhizobium sp. WBOS4]UUO45882.1 Appr-1-p processing protein [Bradyrhizobium sp. WBOS04]UUO59586.1 Appr-1-p processing protein [Bradyrhizobium sp. WBOS08]